MNEKKRYTIWSFHITEEQFNHIEEECRRHGLSKPNFLRLLIKADMERKEERQKPVIDTAFEYYYRYTTSSKNTKSDHSSKKQIPENLRKQMMASFSIAEEIKQKIKSGELKVVI